MKKPGYSQSVSRLFTHSPSGAYLKKKYIQSVDQTDYNIHQLSKSESIFDIDDPNTFIWEHKEKASRYDNDEQITLTPSKFPNRRLNSKSQIIFRRFNKQMKELSKQLPILSVCSQSHLINLDPDRKGNASVNLESKISKNPIQKQCDVNCKRMQSIKKRNLKYKKLNSNFKSFFIRSESTQSKRVITALNHKLVKLNNQNKLIKSSLLTELDPEKQTNRKSKGLLSSMNHFKSKEIKLADFVAKHLNNTPVCQNDLSIHDKTRKMRTEYIRDSNHLKTQDCLHNLMENNLLKSSKKVILKPKTSRSTYLFK